MSIQQVGLNAYSAALRNFARAERGFKAEESGIPKKTAVSSFSETLQDSLAKVNDLQTQKDAMIQSFASGENQNVHELMISLQKAGLAMNITAAVRNKVLETYKELSRLQF